MASNEYDAIVVGARCAGSPTAMLLARLGHKVLVLDKDHFPSDTLSTHMVHPLGIAQLQQWGVLDRVVATGCPAIERYTLVSTLLIKGCLSLKMQSACDARHRSCCAERSEGFL